MLVHRISRLLFVVLVLALLFFLVAGCSEQPDRPRKQQTVKLLPDSPPPPPPPPKPEEKPPPKAEDKPQPQAAPKPAEVPQPQQLKSDEAAGSGPGSGVAAGSVKEDYDRQPTGGGSAGVPVGGAAANQRGIDRAAATAYGQAASRALNEFLVRDRGVRLREYKVRVEIWLSASGALQRAELVDSTGDAQADEALRAALQRFPGTGSTPPARLPQPLRVQVTNRFLG